MEFRDLKKQYKILESEIKEAVCGVMESGTYIGGLQVNSLENELAEYVGAKHCITCANGTDALVLALTALQVGENDAVFIPDFTFFATGEAVLRCGAVPVFVDIDRASYNMSAESLESAIKAVIAEGRLFPKAVIAVDLFGQPADYNEISVIAGKYNLKIVEDGAQGFGGDINGRKACSFGDISATSFFPAKPLGCYGDGGAVFTDCDEYAALIRSLCVHGKGEDKYDNVRVGMNSRLDSIQAAILRVKFEQFKKYELEASNAVASTYNELLENYVGIPTIKEGFHSSWAQYTIQCESEEQREQIKNELKQIDIPSMIYYSKPMHAQTAFHDIRKDYVPCNTAEYACSHVLSLPFHPYISESEVKLVADTIINIVR